MPTGATIALAGAAIIGPVLGGIIGSQQSSAAREAAQQAAQAAYNEIAQLNAPPDESKAIILKHFQQAGLYTPELEKQVDAGISQVSQIQSDQTSKDASKSALNLIMQRAQGGLNASDRATFNQERQATDVANQGKLQAIKQNMAARGLGGSGSELAQQLSAAQNAQNDESAAGDRIAATASQNALNAALQSGQLGNQINAQDFSQDQAKASAADQFKLFDTQNQINQQARNVGSQNTAQQQNLAAAQGISNANTSMDNAELQRQVAAQRQYWQDQANLAGMKANARLGQASNLNSQADATGKLYSGIGAGIGAGAGAGLNYLSKTPATPKDPNDLSSVTNGAPASAPDLQNQAYAHGGIIHGEPVVPGDSPLNDKVPILASPGEAVIPKSIMDMGPEAGYGFLKAMIHNHKTIKKPKV